MELPTTTVALGVATLVVLILLMSCNNSVKPKSTNVCTRRPSRPVHRDLDSDDNHQRSPWGQGVQNRRLNRRERELKNLSGYDDYNSVAQYESLDPEVFASHDEYSSNIDISSSGASSMTTTSHDNYPVPFVGLRRPDMHSSYAGSTARQQHSEYADQMPARSGYML